MITSIKEHIDSHQTQGVEWPMAASYAVVYVCSTWPCGWEKEPTIRFFNTKEALIAWQENMRDWASLEDNYWALKVYEWEWGPQLSEEFPGSGHVPGGKAINVSN